MKKQEVVSAFEVRLEKPMADRRFRVRKSDSVYLKKDGDITCLFDVDVTAMIGWFLVQPAVFVGSARINRLCCAATGRPFSAHQITCGFAVHNVTAHQRGKYSVESADVIPGVADSVLRDYEEFAAPFYAQHASLEGIDAYLNTPRDGMQAAGSVSWACRGLVAAHLRGRPDVRSLAEGYYSFWSAAQGPKIAGIILRTADYLCGAIALTNAPNPGANRATEGSKRRAQA